MYFFRRLQKGLIIWGGSILNIFLSSKLHSNNVYQIFSFESEMKEIKYKMESMVDVYENLQEKMHDVDKTM